MLLCPPVAAAGQVQLAHSSQQRPGTHCGIQGSNRVVAMTHVVEVGTTNACMQAALGDIIDQVVGGKMPPGQLVRELGTVRSAAELCSTVMGASAGKLTAKGANTTGVGGSWIAKRVNQRKRADQKEADLLLGFDDGTKRTALGTVTVGS